MQPTLFFRIVYSGAMSLCMVSVMSAWITFLNLGWAGLSFARWAHALLTAWPVAWIIVFLIAPHIHRVVVALLGRSRSFKG